MDLLPDVVGVPERRAMGIENINKSKVLSLLKEMVPFWEDEKGLDVLWDELKGSSGYDSKMIYPCEVVELRGILNQKK